MTQALTKQDIETWSKIYYEDYIHESCQVTAPQLVFQKWGMAEVNAANVENIAPLSLTRDPSQGPSDMASTWSLSQETNRAC